MAPQYFGVQPVRYILTAERWSLTRAAKEMHVERGHLARVCLGIVRPSPELRERLPKFLDRPLEDLFRPDILAKPYLPGVGRRKNKSSAGK